MATIKAEAGDGTVLIEVEPAYGSEQTSAADRVSAQVDQAVRRAGATVTRIATELTQAVRNVPAADRPQEFTVGFGINFTAEGNAAVAKAGAAASMQVTLTYNIPPTDAATG